MDLLILIYIYIYNVIIDLSRRRFSSLPMKYTLNSRVNTPNMDYSVYIYIYIYMCVCVYECACVCVCVVCVCVCVCVQVKMKASQNNKSIKGIKNPEKVYFGSLPIERVNRKIKRSFSLQAYIIQKFLLQGQTQQMFTLGWVESRNTLFSGFF